MNEQIIISEFEVVLKKLEEQDCIHKEDFADLTSLLETIYHFERLITPSVIKTCVSLYLVLITALTGQSIIKIIKQSHYN